MEKETQTTTSIDQVTTSKRRSWLIAIAVVFILLAGAGGIVYWKISSGYVYTDKATIDAPTIAISSTAAGTLQEVYVNEGDTVVPNAPLARVGNETLKTKSAGLVVDIQNNIGKSFNPGEAVVTLIDPATLRVDGQIEEDKGLSAVQVGQKATFTVDGFSKTYQGIVDEISPTSHQGDVVFNISDQRQVSTFDVKVRYNISEYPELKNGMSAKLKIYK